jgi:hypothetical protein
MMKNAFVFVVFVVLECGFVFAVRDFAVESRSANFFTSVERRRRKVFFVSRKSINGQL